MSRERWDENASGRVVYAAWVSAGLSGPFW
jgi:hypothetical protein